MKVAVYAIALDEACHAERFMRQARAADVVVVADTGSTDGTQHLLRAAGATVHQISVSPWRFDDARNASLALVPGDVDVCVVLDLDEVLSPGWREVLEREWGAATRGRCHFVWSRNEDGSAGLTYQHDRIHQRHGYRWVYPCHEALRADRIEHESVVDLSFEMEHLADPTKSRGQYLALLQVGAGEQPDDARMSHYLGRELMFCREWAAAEAELTRNLTLPGAVWPAERSASMRYLARCTSSLGRAGDAIAWALRATEEAPHLRETWVELAQVTHDHGSWQLCYDAAVQALTITERQQDYFNEGWVWGERADDLASVAAWNLGRFGDARRHGEAALAAAPKDERIAANVQMYRRRDTETG